MCCEESLDALRALVTESRNVLPPALALGPVHEYVGEHVYARGGERASDAWQQSPVH